MIATPDHWHALPDRAGLPGRQGRRSSKSRCATPSAKAAPWLKAAQKHSRVTQMGNHIHNDLPNYRRVVEIVQSGMLGKIQRVYCAHEQRRQRPGQAARRHAAARTRLRLLARPGAQAPLQSEPLALHLPLLLGLLRRLSSSTSGATTPTSPTGRSTSKRR